MRMEALKRAGVKWDRFDLWWSVIEPKKGQWEWKYSDWLIDFYHRNGVGMLPILSYSAAWMNESPKTEQDFRDFGEYVFRTVSRYKGKVRCWEVWNEPNIPTFWKPQPNVSAYVKLLKATYVAAKRADPKCVIVAPGMNMTDINWLRDMAKEGGLRYFDVMSFHPYSLADGPEEMYLAKQIEDARAVLRANGRPNVSLWITEMGWQAKEGDEKALAAQRRFLVQSYVIALAAGVERLFWFNLQDWNEANHTEAWGMLSPEGKEKTTLAVYRRMADTLTGARFVGYVPLGKQGMGYVFERGGKTVVVAWARRGQEARLSLPEVGIVRSLHDGIPAERVRFAESGVIVTPSPVYAIFPRRVTFPGLAKARPVDETNLLQNADMEERGDEPVYGWFRGVFYGGADKGEFAVSDTIAAEGRRSLSLSKTTDALWQSLPVPAVPGEMYTLTGRIRTTDATGENRIQILFLSGPGWGWRGGPVSPTVAGTTERWQTVTVTGTVPEDCGVVRVNLVSKNNTGAVWFDDLTLTRKSAPPSALKVKVNREASAGK